MPFTVTATGLLDGIPGHGHNLSKKGGVGRYTTSSMSAFSYVKNRRIKKGSEKKVEQTFTVFHSDASFFCDGFCNFSLA